jgi:hypothetical protein
MTIDLQQGRFLRVMHGAGSCNRIYSRAAGVPALQA